ncbi:MULTISPECIES: IS630 family transposase [Roseicella]|uniref:IS630 family transposase n=1 Tax=Roseicella frigidaeris TaxID=2230885 RepID=A0A327LV64_9PROT|nr:MULTISPECIES: IS630 family transposase [Roseicella]NOG73995.1 IS630 family transposase [Roseicella sp. DB1501]RAI54063.1 IS630 family transposase [Roseicella frigidaeris]
MSKALSVDLRERVVSAIAAGASCRAAATRFGVSASSAIRWATLAREAGSVAPGPLGGDRRTARIEGHAPLILGLVERTSDITLKEIQAELAKAGVSAGIGTLWRFFDRRRMTWKKKTAHAAEQDRPDILRRRWAWFDDQIDLDPAKLVFIDETWASTNMARTRGRAPRGERLRAGIPHGHWKTTTFVAGLRNTGMVAPMVLDGPINGRAFQAYVDQVLVPELRPCDVVIMDNLGSHKGAGVRASIEAAGTSLLYLPPYSPDFNPIENAFSKLKALLRKAAERTVEGLWDTIGRFIPSFTPAECTNYFAAAGYDPD